VPGNLPGEGAARLPHRLVELRRRCFGLMGGGAACQRSPRATYRVLAGSGLPNCARHRPDASCLYLPHGRQHIRRTFQLFDAQEHAPLHEIGGDYHRPGGACGRGTRQRARRRRSREVDHGEQSPSRCRTISRIDLDDECRSPAVAKPVSSAASTRCRGMDRAPARTALVSTLPQGVTVACLDETSDDRDDLRLKSASCCGSIRLVSVVARRCLVP
jgi:hypothetical protein